MDAILRNLTPFMNANHQWVVPVITVFLTSFSTYFVMYISRKIQEQEQIEFSDFQALHGLDVYCMHLLWYLDDQAEHLELLTSSLIEARHKISIPFVVQLPKYHEVRIELLDNIIDVGFKTEVLNCLDLIRRIGEDCRDIANAYRGFLEILVGLKDRPHFNSTLQNFSDHILDQIPTFLKEIRKTEKQVFLIMAEAALLKNREAPTFYRFLIKKRKNLPHNWKAQVQKQAEDMESSMNPKTV